MFNVFDLLVLIVALAAGYFGFRIGALAGVSYIAGGFTGMLLAHRYAPGSWIHFCLIFLVTAAGVVLLGFTLGRLFKNFFLGIADRLAGALLGFAVGTVIMGIVVVPLSTSLPRQVREPVHASYLTGRLLPLLQKTFPQLQSSQIPEVKNAFPRVRFKEKLNFKISSPGS